MIIPRDIRIVDKLAKLCLSNPVQLRCRHVAALADKNKIVSLGMNKALSDPGFYKLSRSQKKQYVHAEYDCLNNMGTGLGRLTMYVVRVDLNGELAQSKPCPICQRAIEAAGVGRVIHTAERGIVEA